MRLIRVIEFNMIIILSTWLQSLKNAFKPKLLLCITNTSILRTLKTPQQHTQIFEIDLRRSYSKCLSSVKATLVPNLAWSNSLLLSLIASFEKSCKLTNNRWSIYGGRRAIMILWLYCLYRNWIMICMYGVMKTSLFFFFSMLFIKFRPIASFSSTESCRIQSARTHFILTE